jgi:DNA (cytosine-5)-methyltransferase 1
VGVLVFFCGFGGCAAALTGAEVTAAIDLNRHALAVYAHNFPHRREARAVQFLPESFWRSCGAELWWLSPPCQPFTQRGLRRDVEDPRARPFLAVIERLCKDRPRYVAMENVPGFQGSRAHAVLRESLEKAGYSWVRERLLCPSQLGLPNQRRRFYLVAGREALLEPVTPRLDHRPLAQFLDPSPDPALAVTAELLSQYKGALRIVDAEDPQAVTTCFTSAYGRSHVRSGSYLHTSSGVRRFSPTEILRLLDFPETYTLPPGIELASAWRLVGNSLSLAPVRMMLAMVPGLF